MKPALVAGLLLVLSAAAVAGPKQEGSAAGPRRVRPSAAAAGGPAAEGKAFDPAQAGGRQTPLRRGNALLKRGMFRLAATAFSEAVAADPLSSAAHVGLGTALARNGNCADAMPEFRDWSDALNFGARVALLAAHCADRQNEPEVAVAFSLLAWERRMDDRTALARLALDADRVGDRVLVEVATEYLWYVNPEQDESLFVEAALALRRGELGQFDVVDELWRREGRASEEMNRLRARSWLDAGDPLAAYEELRQGGKKLRRGGDSRVMMAETARRLGLLADAERALDSRLMGRLTSADADAVKVRLLVDAGQLADAQALIAGYPDEVSEDLVASRWYLARAVGNEVAETEAAALYQRVRTSPLRSLDQYVPVTRAR